MHIVDIFEREDYSVSTQDTGRYLLKEDNHQYIFAKAGYSY